MDKKRFYKNKRELLGSVVLSGDSVLDLGFWGQGVLENSSEWPHRIIKDLAKDVYGLDIEFDEKKFSGGSYTKSSAEDFNISRKFSLIFAGDIIEHLSNLGSFLAACRRHLDSGGRLVITTPNCFNLFTLAGKIMHQEPVVNHDHTCYFNEPTLTRLLEKNGFRVSSVSFVYTLDVHYRESVKKKILNVLYWFLSLFSTKYLETLVIVAVPQVP